MKPSQKKQIVEELCSNKQLSISRACSVINLRKQINNYKTVKDDAALATTLQQKAADYLREGLQKAFGRLRIEGQSWNHKRVYRVYRSQGLSLRNKVKKRLSNRVKMPLQMPQELNDTWSIDFMSDALLNGRKFRSFHVMDDYSRQALQVESNFSLKRNRVVWILNHLIKRRGKPRRIRIDNGSEFMATLMPE